MFDFLVRLLPVFISQKQKTKKQNRVQQKQQLKSTKETHYSYYSNNKYSTRKMKFARISTVSSCTSMLMLILSAVLLTATTTTVTATSPPMTECGGASSTTTQTLTGTINSDVLVKADTYCQLSGATVNGNVYLQDSSKLYVVRDSVVNGDIFAYEVAGDPWIVITQSTTAGNIHVTRSTMAAVQITGSSTVGGDVIVEDSTLTYGISGKGTTTIRGKVFMSGVTTLDANKEAFHFQSTEIMSDVTIIGCNFAGRFRMYQKKIGGNLNIHLTTVGGTQFILTGVEIAGDLDIGALDIDGYVKMNSNVVGGSFQIADTTVINGYIFVYSNHVKGGSMVIDNCVLPGGSSVVDDGSIYIMANSAEQIIVKKCAVEKGEIISNTVDASSNPESPFYFEGAQNLAVIENTFNTELRVKYNTVSDDLVVLGNVLSSSLPMLTGNTVVGATQLDFAN